MMMKMNALSGAVGVVHAGLGNVGAVVHSAMMDFHPTPDNSAMAFMLFAGLMGSPFMGMSEGIGFLMRPQGSIKPPKIDTDYVRLKNWAVNRTTFRQPSGGNRRKNRRPLFMYMSQKCRLSKYWHNASGKGNFSTRRSIRNDKRMGYRHRRAIAKGIPWKTPAGAGSSRRAKAVKKVHKGASSRA